MRYTVLSHCKMSSLQNHSNAKVELPYHPSTTSNKNYTVYCTISVLYLVSVCRNNNYSWNPKIKWSDREASTVHEGEDKATHAAINIHRNIVSLPQCTNGLNVIYDAMWKAGCRSHKLKINIQYVCNMWKTLFISQSSNASNMETTKPQDNTIINTKIFLVIIKKTNTIL